MARILDLETELKELEKGQDKAVAEVTSVIKSINNPSCEDVLTARYLEFKDWTIVMVYDRGEHGLELARMISFKDVSMLVSFQNGGFFIGQKSLDK